MTKCANCKKTRDSRDCKKLKCNYHLFQRVCDNVLCLDCYNIFPFNSLEDPELNTLLGVQNENESAVKFTSKMLNRLEYDLVKEDLCLNEKIDPDVNFYKNVVYQKSLYFDNDEFCKMSTNVKSELSIMHNLNCRSLRKNFDKVFRMIENLDFSFDVIAMTETWLSENDCIDLYKLDGYNIDYKHREGKTGGGILIYSKNNLVTSVISSHTFCEPDYMEALALEIQDKLNKTKINFACIYRPLLQI